MRYEPSASRLVPSQSPLRVMMACAVLGAAIAAAIPARAAPAPLEIGTRRELMVDRRLIAKLSGGAELRLHHPTARGVALETDRPWEGNVSGMSTVFRDGDRYRMYYKAYDVHFEDGGRKRPHPWYVCYAESENGVEWRRPELGVVAFDGAKRNNIVWAGAGPDQRGVHGFSAFKDPNPEAAPEHRYKAVGAERRAIDGDLWAMSSPDGIHWSILGDEPIMEQGKDGRFDAQNVAFWDAHRGEYRAYVRAFAQGRRVIATATSPDFRNWGETKRLRYSGAPKQQLYTSQILPYSRAPHLLLGFPTRYIERAWSPAIANLPERAHRERRAAVKEPLGTALTDGLFMSSRDGRTFRRWSSAFLRPGPQRTGNWAYGDNYQSWGLIRTPAKRAGAPDRLSFFATEGYWRGDGTTFRRYTIRIDGFVSLRAPLAGGSMRTTPLAFEGSRLRLNFATSAAGSIRVGLRSASGEPIEGHTIGDCDPVIGDELARAVTWNGDADVSDLAGRAVRLRFVLRDADLYAFRFGAK